VEDGTEMKITESQLRKIVRQEILRESSRSVDLWAKDHYPAGTATALEIRDILSAQGLDNARVTFVPQQRRMGGTYGRRIETDPHEVVRIEHPEFEGGFLELTRSEFIQQFL